MPTSWQTTSRIRRRLPAGGRQVRPERRCAGGTEWFLCLQQAPSQVFPECFEWGWHREQVSCNRARIVLESSQIPANLKQIISIIAIIAIISKKIISIIAIMVILCFMAYNTYNSHSWYNYHCQDHRRIPTSKQVHNRRTWIQCQSQQMLRTGVEPAHTRQCPATQRRLNCRCPAAESLRNPCDGWHETFSQEMDSSKPSEPHCTWCAPPNNCTELNDPCAWQTPAIPMSPEEQ